MLHEAALRSGINTILDETAGDEDELVCIREICQETLARMDRVTAEKSLAHRQECNSALAEAVEAGEDAMNGGAIVAFSPPKSPQDRLLALVPNAMEKGKSKLSRRPSPSNDSFPAAEMPRWKIIDGNEDPITDLTVIFRGDSVPDGFTKLERSQSGQRADLNKGGRGTFVYLCHCKDQSSGKAPISEIIAIFPERGEFVPSDYEVVRRRGVPANINTGTQGEKIFLCFKRSATSAIVDLVVLFPRKNESLPYG
ncbi:hypothetical protein PHYSODRAFT_467556 [Phytophthora sojae]|uniref:MABP domain-containing protein n=1 Tax=Phytophthora sojae (strain P6497) TaxID=1094619 RepID=G4YQE4_PHYSP|nr:hypothetical protein PHYSODRAFT_467556 [Phytophthora sojae]EGZ29910.1 hypothetical protein PHYSODRAFT_467556 [Phytophthora sojae]|eukprot:XP_009517185.1 hypothetical protein PHYSODRAFT_467556 [Phytophthora sojae]